MKADRVAVNVLYSPTASFYRKNELKPDYEM